MKSVLRVLHTLSIIIPFSFIMTITDIIDIIIYIMITIDFAVIIFITIEFLLYNTILWLSMMKYKKKYSKNKNCGTD